MTADFAVVVPAVFVVAVVLVQAVLSVVAAELLGLSAVMLAGPVVVVEVVWLSG